VPLQNRVTPFGAIVATPARGAWMGNRGRLHDDAKRLTHRRWTTRAWIVCRLRFRGRHRPVMAPGRYTELFFLDEATALAAGHRPCAECRRADYVRYRDGWAVGAGADPRRVRADDIDAVLHAERVRPVGDALRLRPLAGLPDGAFVALADAPDAAWLLHGGRLWRWTPFGYRAPRPADDRLVALLTPPATVAALAHGYAAQIDPSAGGVLR
jgi:hypothetical protein